MQNNRARFQWWAFVVLRMVGCFGSFLFFYTLFAYARIVGNPANIKGRGYCLDFEVETSGQVSMTVQSFEPHFKTVWQNIATYFFLEMIWMQLLRLWRQMTMLMNILKNL